LKSILEEKGKFGESGGGWTLVTRGDMLRGKGYPLCILEAGMDKSRI
jgi:hypothetical protein